MPDQNVPEIPKSTLEKINDLSSALVLTAEQRLELLHIKSEIANLEQINYEARELIEKLDAAVNKLTQPANKTGTYLGTSNDLYIVATSGGEYYCALDSRLKIEELRVGGKVLLNEAFAIIRLLAPDTNGQIVKVNDILIDGRLRVGTEQGSSSFMVLIGDALKDIKIKKSTEVKLDSYNRVALEVIAQPEEKDNLLDTVEPISWDKIGGLKDAKQAIRDSIELPIIYKDLFKTYNHQPPKGILLHGASGLGKTLIGKAIAYNLRIKLKEITGIDKPEYFMHVKGSELLTMWVGESERKVRELFSRARTKAKEGHLSFIFIDEAEALLSTRRGGNSNGGNLSNTVVPAFLSELDGIDPLSDVIVILATNRADLIDTAVLRSGRCDLKIKVNRPNREESKEIYKIYITEDLPFSYKLNRKFKIKQDLIEHVVEAILTEQFSKNDSNRFLQINTKSGREHYLYRGDLVSGAIIASIVKRAKHLAIKRTISNPKDIGLEIEDFLNALVVEYKENELFPPMNMLDDWLKLIDHIEDNIIKIGPVDPQIVDKSCII